MATKSVVSHQSVKRRVRKGIPSSMRQEVWPIICNLKGIKNDSHFFYDELVAKENWVFEEEIKKDVVRTFQDNIFFIRDVGKEAITQILKAVSFAFPSMGYTQGMSFIAGFFCFYLSNEEAFWMFVYFFEKRGMLTYFKNLENIERFSFISDRLLDKYMNKVFNHMVVETQAEQMSDQQQHVHEQVHHDLLHWRAAHQHMLSHL